MPLSTQPTTPPMSPSTPQELIEPTPALTPTKVAASPPTTDPPASGSSSVTVEMPALPPSTIDPTNITQTVPPRPIAHQLPQIEIPQENAGPSENIDPREIKRIRKAVPRFRILITGRANSGKTTIIQRMCDSNEDPIVHDEWGIRQPASILKNPNATRGIHNIRLKITYKSNPNFEFHDSMGFESGSEDEVETVKDFIKEMLAKSTLQDRLHAIWFCAPTDSDRVAFKAELSFFQQSTGGIPVIVVFTKWDGQIIDAYNNLRRRENMDIRQAKLEAPVRARKILEEEYIPVFKNTPFPPAAYAVLGYMDKPETKCSELAEKTAAALNDKVLKKLFVSVQTHNIKLCIRGGINEAVCKYIYSFKGPDNDKVIRAVVSWFPHFYLHNYSYEKEEKWDWDYRYHKYESPALFQPLVSGSTELFSTRRLQTLRIAAGTAIIATRSFDIKQRTENTNTTIKASVEEYLASSQRDAVKTTTTAKFRQYTGFSALTLSKSKLEHISAELQQICLDNLLH